MGAGHAGTLPTGTDRSGPGRARPVEERPDRCQLWTAWWTPDPAGPGGRRREVRCGRARPRLGPPPGPGRLLRRGRAARQALAARQAGGGGRGRRPRRGVHGVVRGPQVRRPLGHVDPRGSVAVPARGVPDRPVPRLPRRQPIGDGAAARRSRRWSSRSRSTRRSSTSRRPGCPTSRSPTVTAFAEELRGRVAEATGGLTASVGIGTLEVHRQGRQRPRQARRPGRRAPGHRAGAAPADARHRHPRRRPGHRRAAAPGRHPHRRRARVGQPRRAGPAGRQGARHRPLRAGPRRRRPAGRAGARDQVGQRRGHLRHRPDRPQADGGPAHPAGRPTSPTRLRKHGLSGRTVTIKVRLHDFTTLNRSTTLPSPTDSGATVARLARGLLADLDTSGGVRLLGRRRLRARRLDPGGPVRRDRASEEPGAARGRGHPGRATGTGWSPGMDVVHDEMGRGWVWGSGRGVVTVRFETAETPAGPVRSYAADDPALHPWRPGPRRRRRRNRSRPRTRRPSLVARGHRELDAAALADDAVMRDYYDLIAPRRAARPRAGAVLELRGVPRRLSAPQDSGERQELVRGLRRRPDGRLRRAVVVPPRQHRQGVVQPRRRPRPTAAGASAGRCSSGSSRSRRTTTARWS